MISITPDIIGPGIDEEYEDAVSAIRGIRDALGPRNLTNDTPDGRLLLEVAWVQQEIEARRLPIPVDASYVGTIYYLVGSGELNHVPGLQPALERLYIVLKGIGLIKVRHVPVLIALIDQLFEEARGCWSDLDDEEREIMTDMHRQADTLREGKSWPPKKPPQDSYSSFDNDNLEARIVDFFGRASDIDAALFDCWRLEAVRKGPLPAPVPGLPPHAPPVPPELEGRLP